MMIHKGGLQNDFCKKVALGVGGLLLLAPGSAQQVEQQHVVQAKRPNILFICSDQHAFKYTGFHGHPYVKTPNLDQLARDGVVFTNAYSCAPVCVPGRASLMTGMYASDVGSYDNSTVWDGSYPVWGTYFQNNGYYTCAFGKLDLDDTKSMGFKTTPSDNEHKHKSDITSLFRMPLAYRADEREQIDGHERENYDTHDLRVTNEALKFLKEKSGKLNQPWMMYLGYVQPHPDFVALKKYYDQYYPNQVDMPDVSDEEIENISQVYKQLRHFKGIATPIDQEKIRRARAAYYGMISELDELIGRVIQSLKENGQYENTVIVYTSDHGESLGEHGLWLKNNLYDCAIRIPLILKGPDIPSGKQVDIPVSQIDLTPTVLGCANIDVPAYLRGENLNRFFSVNTANKENVVYSENHSEGNCTGSFMIRRGDWKYIYFSYYDDLLFNLKNDPRETVNLADSENYSAIENELKNELFDRVNPDKITAEAFTKQKAFLDSLVRNNSGEQLINLLKSRLGEGQARIISKRLKGKF